jgi:hypothetical protein
VSLIQKEVDRLFKEATDRNRNPVTEEGWLMGVDPMAPQKKKACRALFAREWLAIYGPSDIPPLPLSHGDREDLKVGGILHIYALYARSLACRDFNVQEHPSFDDYARGVMASEYTLASITQDEALKKRFPPQKLAGLGPGLCWEPRKNNEKARAHFRRLPA